MSGAVSTLPGVPSLAKNYRLVREIVLEQERGVHLTMAEIHELARHRKRGIGFTTVYRALVRLRDLGLVSEIVLPGAPSAYYETPATAHAHFRCDCCGRIADLEYVTPKRSVGQLARRYGIEVRETLLSLHGRCAACRAAEA